MRSHEGHGSQYSQCELGDLTDAKETRFIGPALRARFWPPATSSRADCSDRPRTNKSPGHSVYSTVFCMQDMEHNTHSGLCRPPRQNWVLSPRRQIAKHDGRLDQFTGGVASVTDVQAALPLNLGSTHRRPSNSCRPKAGT